MKVMRHKIVLFVLLLGLPGCTAIKDIVLTKDVEEFSHATEGLSQIVSANFALAEKINAIATIGNIQFQLELGGKPETEVKPLFSADNLAKRQDALNLLTNYANTLTAIVQNTSFSASSFSIPAAVKSLKSFDYRDFDLTHTLQVENAKTLVNDLSIFQELFVLPKRDEKLEKIVETGDTAVKRMAMLLYIDIGEKADQSANCSYKAPDLGAEKKISNLRLCRGGLRTIVDTAFKSDLDVWKSKLSLLSGATDAPKTANRMIMVQRIVAIQKTAQEMDRLLAGTQSALMSMVSAHASLVDILTYQNKQSTASSALPTGSTLFLEKVSVLAASVKLVGTALDGLQTSNATYTDLQDLEGNQNDT
jgi:hypothetical protein